MTALAALWARTTRIGHQQLDRMLNAQTAYAPSPAVTKILGEASIGRRLHALLPEDVFDRGPIIGGDGTLLLTADARIDNREDLSEQLGWSSLDLARTSEPALLMAIIERWGVSGLAQVIGAFAVILWDDRRRALVLARDAMGERPLHYYHETGLVAASSMPCGLHALPHVPYAANPAAVADFLAGIPEREETSFAGIKRVLPGHAVTFTRESKTAVRLWAPSLEPLRLTPGDYVDGLREQLDRAVACRLRRANGNVGAHLSAGLDSASVATTAARQLAPERLFAFTAVPGSPTSVGAGTMGDEGELAATTASCYPTMDHILVQGRGVSPLEGLDRHFALYQRPFTNLCNAVWIDAINDVARDCGVRVLLTGQQGNMTISYSGVAWPSHLLRRGRLIALARLCLQMLAHGSRAKHVAALTLEPLIPVHLWRWLLARLGKTRMPSALSALLPEAIVELDLAGRAAARGSDLDHRLRFDGQAMRLKVINQIDIAPFIKGTLAGWGIDLRDPTADRRLVEFTLRVPEEQFILGGEFRSLARRALSDRLPQAVLLERRKGLQSADWYVGATSARHAMLNELDTAARCQEARNLIDLERLNALVADWPTAHWNDRLTSGTYRSTLLRGLSASHFLRKVAGTN